MTKAEAFTAIKKLLGFDLPAPVAPVLPVVPPVVPMATASVDYPLADGTVISIDNLAVGGKATIGGAPAPDGVYSLQDGTSVTTVAGIITVCMAATPAAPDTPIDMSTPAAMRAAIDKFATNLTPSTADIAIMVRALCENAFGYEIRRNKEQEAIALYNSAFAEQKEGLKQLVALVEDIAGTEVTTPVEKKEAVEKPWNQMNALEKFRATK